MISVVVPVYNAENYLQECINSVLSQNFEDFELLLIDDGSTDSSGSICDKFEKLDNRVKVYHKANGGVSSARNLGIKEALGHWITFVDSDDYLSENYFQPAVEHPEKDYIVLNSNIVRNDVVPFRVYEPQVLDQATFLQQYNLFRDFATPWARFFKKAIIEDNHLIFDENFSKGEDVLFNLHYILHCKSVALSNASSYNYRVLNNSLSKQKVSIAKSQSLYDQIYKLLKSYKNEPDFISTHMEFSAMQHFFNVLNSDYNWYKKKVVLKELLNRHKKFLVKSMKGQKISGLPADWLVKTEFLDLLILISNLQQIRSAIYP